MDKLLLVSLMLIPVILISGCTGTIITPTKPFLKLVEIEDNFLRNYESTNINFIVSNPLQITFNGKVEFKYDANCMYMSQYQLENIQVPNNSEKPLSTTLDVRFQTFSNEKCITGGKEVTVILKDINNNVMDFKTLQVNLVE